MRKRENVRRRIIEFDERFRKSLEIRNIFPAGKLLFWDKQAGLPGFLITIEELRLIYLLHNLVQTSKLKPNSLW